MASYDSVPSDDAHVDDQLTSDPKSRNSAEWNLVQARSAAWLAESKSNGRDASAVSSQTTTQDTNPVWKYGSMRGAEVPATSL